MALTKDNIYWMISNIELGKKMKVAKVTISGYSNKEDADADKNKKGAKFVNLQGSFYPFVNDLGTVDQMSNAYIQIKNKDNYFKDAIDA